MKLRTESVVMTLFSAMMWPGLNFNS